MTYHRVCNYSNTTGATCWAGIPENFSSLPDFSRDRVVPYLVFCVVFCRSFCAFVFFLLAIHCIVCHSSIYFFFWLSPFGIFKTSSFCFKLETTTNTVVKLVVELTFNIESIKLLKWSSLLSRACINMYTHFAPQQGSTVCTFLFGYRYVLSIYTLLT